MILGGLFFWNHLNAMIVDMIEKYQDTALGWKISGAGGGGYLILVSDQPIADAFQIIIRRRSDYKG